MILTTSECFKLYCQISSIFLQQTPYSLHHYSEVVGDTISLSGCMNIARTYQ